MTEYTTEFAASAAKEFRALPEEIKWRVRKAVESLHRNPRPTGVRKLHSRDPLYRIRVGQYRVVYELDDEAERIRITRVRHRRDAYEEPL